MDEITRHLYKNRERNNQCNRIAYLGKGFIILGSRVLNSYNLHEANSSFYENPYPVDKKIEPRMLEERSLIQNYFKPQETFL